MVYLEDLELQYITNEAGDKTDVILPLEQFQQLLEDIEDLVAVAERRDEELVSHSDVISQLKRDGLL